MTVDERRRLILGGIAAGGLLLVFLIARGRGGGTATYVPTAPSAAEFGGDEISTIPADAETTSSAITSAILGARDLLDVVREALGLDPGGTAGGGFFSSDPAVVPKGRFAGEQPVAPPEINPPDDRIYDVFPEPPEPPEPIVTIPTPVPPATNGGTRPPAATLPPRPPATPAPSRPPDPEPAPRNDPIWTPPVIELPDGDAARPWVPPGRRGMF